MSEKPFEDDISIKVLFEPHIMLEEIFHNSLKIHPGLDDTGITLKSRSLHSPV